MKEFIIKSVVVLFLFILVLQAYTFYHEDTHRQIMYQHGCINSTIELNIFATSYARCYDYNFRSNETILQEDFLHSMNEIVGYHFQVLLMTIFIVLLVFMNKEEFKKCN